MDTDPPDPGGGSVVSPDVFDSQSQPISRSMHRKRAQNDPDSSSIPVKKSSVAQVIASAQTTYTIPEYMNDKISYSDDDIAPFVVHVAKKEELTQGTVFRAIQIGKFLHSNNIKNIISDGVKKVGRNRISVEFKSAADANSFLNHPALNDCNYIVNIPSFNVSRMGIIREVPVDWTMEELIENIQVPPGFGKVFRARRLHRKSTSVGSAPTWIPTQTVVLTFTGKKLPQHVYCYFTSLPVEIYRLPVIQCNNCCRFGHIKAQCRSKPRCFKCGDLHEGEACLSQAPPKCILCSGNHLATYFSCPEHERQKSIKLVMSQESVSYMEASARFSPIKKSFADSARISPPPSIHIQSSTSPRTPTTSYRKTVEIPRHPRLPASSHGYDRNYHNDISHTPTSSLPNGCAYTSTPSAPPEPNDNLLEMLLLQLSTLINFIQRFNDIELPYNIRQKLTELSSFNNKIHSDTSVEL